MSASNENESDLKSQRLVTEGTSDMPTALKDGVDSVEAPLPTEPLTKGKSSVVQAIESIKSGILELNKAPSLLRDPAN